MHKHRDFCVINYFINEPIEKNLSLKLSDNKLIRSSQNRDDLNFSLKVSVIICAESFLQELLPTSNQDYYQDTLTVP